MKYTCPLCGATMFLGEALPSLVCPKCAVSMIPEETAADSREPCIGVSGENAGLKIARPLGTGLQAGNGAPAMQTQAPSVDFRLAGASAYLSETSGNSRLSGIAGEKSWDSGLETQCCSLPLPGFGAPENVSGCIRRNAPESGRNISVSAGGTRLSEEVGGEDFQRKYQDCRRELRAAEEDCIVLEDKLNSIAQDFDKKQTAWSLQQKQQQILECARQAKIYFFRLNLTMLLCLYALCMALQQSGWKAGVSWGVLLLLCFYFLVLLWGMIARVQDISVLAAEKRKIRQEAGKTGRLSETADSEGI